MDGKIIIIQVPQVMVLPVALGRVVGTQQPERFSCSSGEHKQQNCSLLLPS